MKQALFLSPCQQKQCGFSFDLLSLCQPREHHYYLPPILAHSINGALASNVCTGIVEDFLVEWITSKLYSWIQLLDTDLLCRIKMLPSWIFYGRHFLA